MPWYKSFYKRVIVVLLVFIALGVWQISHTTHKATVTITTIPSIEDYCFDPAHDNDPVCQP